jgi:hypothetical protein
VGDVTVETNGDTEHLYRVEHAEQNEVHYGGPSRHDQVDPNSETEGRDAYGDKRDHPFGPCAGRVQLQDGLCERFPLAGGSR